MTNGVMQGQGSVDRTVVLVVQQQASSPPWLAFPALACVLTRREELPHEQPSGTLPPVQLQIGDIMSNA